MRQSLASSPTRRGDTIIEVLFGVAIFGLVAILSVNLMNNGLATSEDNLETNMARNEMNAQSEALYFIHSAYASTGKAYKAVWDEIIQAHLTEDREAATASYAESECSDFFHEGGLATGPHAFALNTTAISENPRTTIMSNDSVHEATGDAGTFPYPFATSEGAYGIWINAVAGRKTDDSNRPYYYDFYVRSCWYGTSSSAPTMLDNVIRLYNPERVQV